MIFSVNIFFNALTLFRNKNMFTPLLPVYTKKKSVNLPLYLCSTAFLQPNICSFFSQISTFSPVLNASTHSFTLVLLSLRSSLRPLAALQPVVGDVPLSLLGRNYGPPENNKAADRPDLSCLASKALRDT